jgi:hypothetical protein
MSYPMSVKHCLYDTLEFTAVIRLDDCRRAKLWDQSMGEELGNTSGTLVY